MSPLVTACKGGCTLSNFRSCGDPYTLVSACDFHNVSHVKRAKNSWSKSKELVVSTPDARTKFVWESKGLMVSPFENSGSYPNALPRPPSSSTLRPTGFPTFLFIYNPEHLCPSAVLLVYRPPPSAAPPPNRLRGFLVPLHYCPSALFSSSPAAHL